jgi:hypothetical protein
MAAADRICEADPNYRPGSKTMVGLADIDVYRTHVVKFTVSTAKAVDAALAAGMDLPVTEVNMALMEL